MVITSKRGSQDNVLTYEHICDESADLSKIDPHYITLGSVAIVLQGQTGLEIYMANSKKEWISLGAMSSGNGAASSGPESNVVGEGQSGHMIIHDGEAASDLADKGQADSMVLSA